MGHLLGERVPEVPDHVVVEVEPPSGQRLGGVQPGRRLGEVDAGLGEERVALTVPLHGREGLGEDQPAWTTSWRGRQTTSWYSRRYMAGASYSSGVGLAGKGPLVRSLLRARHFSPGTVSSSRPRPGSSASTSAASPSRTTDRAVRSAHVVSGPCEVLLTHPPPARTCPSRCARRALDPRARRSTTASKGPWAASCTWRRGPWEPSTTGTTTASGQRRRISPAAGRSRSSTTTATRGTASEVRLARTWARAATMGGPGSVAVTSETLGLASTMTSWPTTDDPATTDTS